MMPRRISRVPPRKVQDGACSTASASAASSRSPSALAGGAAGSATAPAPGRRARRRRRDLLPTPLRGSGFRPPAACRRPTATSAAASTDSRRCGRALRQAPARDRRRRARPTRPAPACDDRKRSGPLRSKASSLVTCRQPSPSPPTSRSLGTKTRSSTISLKSCSPARLRIGRIVTPGAFRSTISCVSPAWRLLRVERIGAHQRDRVMRLVRVARPHLRAGHLVAAADRDRAGADRGQIGAGIRLAHADREKDFAAADAGQKILALLVAAVAQQERPALPVGDPVAADRRAGCEQFLGDRIAFEKAALAAAIALRPRHADPAALAEAAAEIGGAVRAEIAVRGPAPGGEFVGDKLADFAGAAPRIRAAIRPDRNETACSSPNHTGRRRLPPTLHYGSWACGTNPASVGAPRAIARGGRGSTPPRLH